MRQTWGNTIYVFIECILSLINEMYMEKIIVPMLQLLTCVQFIDFLGISASDFHLCWLLHVSLHVSTFSWIACRCHVLLHCPFSSSFPFDFFLLRCLCFFFILLSPFLSLLFFSCRCHRSILYQLCLLSFFFVAFVSSSFCFIRFFPCFFLLCFPCQVWVLLSLCLDT